MEKWIKVFREGLLPQLSRQDLEVLLKAVIEDDPALIQGETVVWKFKDHALHSLCTPTNACLIGYLGMKSGCQTVGSVHEFFFTVCSKMDRLTSYPSSHHFTNWFDETPRETMRSELRSELERALREVANV